MATCRKWLCCLLALALLLTSACVPAFAEETYTASAKGFGGDVTVTLTLDGNRLTGVTAEGANETPGVGTVALEKLPAQMRRTGTIAVDAVAGATFTSQAVLAAAADALAQAGLTAEQLVPAEADAQAVATDVNCDVVIVGAGAAGMSAAIEAANLGMNVIVVEKMSMVGGTTTLASTAINAGGSSIQAKLGIEFSAEDYYAKESSTANGKRMSEDYLRVLTSKSGEAIDWLVDMGADLGRVINNMQHTPTDGGSLGAMLVPLLSSQMDAKGVDVRTDTKAVSLIEANGKVCGVAVEDPDGSYTIGANAVVLATGTFAASPEMVSKYTPAWAGYPSTSAVGCTGDGINMALELGAAVANMDVAVTQTFAYDTGKGAISMTNVRHNGAILVNNQGVRFASESAVKAVDIKAQDGGYGFLIFDQTVMDSAAFIQQYNELGYFTKGETIEELAEKLGLPAAQLAETCARYAGFVKAGKDEDFGRASSMFSAIDTAPFYGVKISPANQSTFGGLVTDVSTRVLREDGSAIEGLYAAGEVCNYSIYTTSPVVYGRIAAQTAYAEMNGQLNPGTYTVSAQGNNGSVKLAVTVDAHAITGIEVVSHSETKGIGTVALERLPQEIVAAQSLNVDTITSATRTCTAIKMAVSEALDRAGVGTAALTPVAVEKEASVYSDCTADAVIIGAGGAGMAAAIKAAEKGLNVILLEKMDLIGGTTVMAAVGVNAGGSDLQLAMDPVYTADMFYEYLSSIGTGIDAAGKTVVPLRPDYAYAFAYNSADMINWMTEIGVPLYALNNSHSHQMTTKENGLFGEVLVEKMAEQLQEKGVDVRVASKATEIVMKDGKMAGVKVAYNGGEYTIATNYAVIATGGYGSGKEVVAEFAPEWAGYPSTEAVSATGDGIYLALNAGGSVSDMNAITFRTLAVGADDEGGAVGMQNAPKAGAMLVNASGVRFINESTGNQALMEAVKAQEGNCAYVILTQEMVDGNADMATAYKKQALVKAATLEELAEKLGLPADALKATAEKYSAAVAAGKDEEFGREKMTLAVAEGPFYGAKVKPSKHICTGGITINGKAEVLNENDEPVPGLYAAGETTNHGNHPVSAAVVFGRIAADEIAEKLGK